MSYYDYITSLHVGESIWYENPTDYNNMGMRYRAVIVSEEVYRTLYIETFRLGDEGSQKLVVTKGKHFGEAILKFVEWRSPQTFVLEVNGKAKLATIGKEGGVTLSEL